MDPREIEIEALAATQLGRFTRAQVAQFVDRPAALVQRRLRSGRWRRLSSRVLMLPGAPAGDVADLWTAHLHVGADSVVSHLSALVVAEFPGVPRGRPTLIVPDGANRRFAARLCQRSDLAAQDVTAVDGLPTTTVARTLADIASEVSVARLEAWLDYALGERLVTIAGLREVLGRLRRPRKTTQRPLEDLVADLLPGSSVEQTRLERLLTAAVRRAGLPDGLAQHEAPGRPGDATGLVDRAWPEVRWVVEADGRRWHERRGTMRTDRARDRAASAVGWLTTRVMWEDLESTPEAVAEDLRAIWEQRCADDPCTG